MVFTTTGILPAGHPFLNFDNSGYLTSTTLAGAPEKTWAVSMSDGFVFPEIKNQATGNVTAVRSPK